MERITEREKRLGQDCIDLIGRKLSKKTSNEEFYIGLLELDKKYPMEDHNPPLTPFQVKNYLKIKMAVKDPDSAVIYENHLQPLNFQESAEMFIRQWDKPKERLPYKDN